MNTDRRAIFTIALDTVMCFNSYTYVQIGIVSVCVVFKFRKAAVNSLSSHYTYSQGGEQFIFNFPPIHTIKHIKSSLHHYTFCIHIMYVVHIWYLRFHRNKSGQVNTSLLPPLILNQANNFLLVHSS
jgi:hypothetical protein